MDFKPLPEGTRKQIAEELNQFKETVEELKHSIKTHKGELYYFQIAAMADLIRATNEINDFMCGEIPLLLRLHAQTAAANAINMLVYACLQLPADKDMTPKEKARGEEFGTWVRRLVEAERRSDGRIKTIVVDSFKGGKNSHD